MAGKWTDERVKLLKKLWGEGLSAHVIAQRMLGSGLSRNAVLGKVHRMGLADRATTLRGKGPKRVRKTGKGWQANSKPKATGGTNGAPRVQFGNPDNWSGEAKAVEPYVEPKEELVIPVAERKTLQALTDQCCRWPIGDPQKEDFHFCGKSKVTGLPYCEYHAKRAYVPAQPRVRKPVDPTVPRLRAPASDREDVF